MATIDPAAFALAGRPEYRDLSDDDAATLANTPSITRIDTAQHNYQWIASNLDGGVDLIGALDPKLIANGLMWVSRSMSGDGLNFADPVTRATIDKLVVGGVFTQDQADTLKAIGTHDVSPYADAGGKETVLAKAFTDARAEFARQAVRARVTLRYNDVINAFDAGSISTFDEARAILGAP